MDELEYIRRLGQHARREEPPTVDAAARIMARIRRRAAQSAPEVRALQWVAAVGAAVAVPLAIAAAFAWQAWVDPLMAAAIDPSWSLL